MHRRISTFILVFLLSFTNHALGDRAELQTSRKSILNVGALYHLTGDYAVQGEAFRQGSELALTELKKEDPSHVSQLSFEDTQYIPRQTATGAQRFLAQRIQASLISTLTEAKVAVPILSRAHIPVVVLWDASPELEKLSPNVFGIGPWTPASGELAAQFSAQRLKGKKAAVITSPNEWALYVGAAFAKKWRSLEKTSLVEVELSPTESDFRSVLTKLKSEDPDVIYVAIDSNIPAFFKQLKQQSFRASIVTSDIITDDYFEGDAKKDFEGVYQTMPKALEIDKVALLSSLYVEHFKRPLSQAQFVAWGYDGMLILHEAQKIFENGKATSLSQAVRQIKDLPGMSGTISFNGGQSSPNPLGVYQVRNGAFISPQESSDFR